MVWALLDRDYSVNQPRGNAVQYNNNDLPVKFRLSNDDYRLLQQSKFHSLLAIFLK